MLKVEGNGALHFWAWDKDGNVVIDQYLYPNGLTIRQLVSHMDRITNTLVKRADLINQIMVEEAE